jgi:hypothetical protein
MALVVAVSLAATACTGPAGPSHQPGPPADHPAGTAEPLPGLAALLPRGAAIILSRFSPVSCSGPGDCTAIGTVYYDVAGNPEQPAVDFVTDERGGAWQPARLLPVRAVVAGDGPATATGDLWCSSPGDCTAVGATHRAAPFTSHVIMATETDGTWGMPFPAPGVSRLSANDAQVPRIACGPAGNCLIVGIFPSRTLQGDQVFALTESAGRWGSASAIPRVGADGESQVTINGVSCGPSGACTVAGEISNAIAATDGGFIATETAGKWRPPALFPGIAIQAIACPAVGDCTAVGRAAGRTPSGFAVTGHDGTWSAPVPLPGMAQVTSLSCSAAGTCIAGGAAFLHPGDRPVGAAVATEDGGTWKPARLLDASRLPGAQPAQPPAPDPGGPLVNSQVTSVSCTPAGDCLAAGFYSGPPTLLASTEEAFLAFGKSGTWSAAGTVPGMPALAGARGSTVTAIAYSGAGHWALTGTYDAGNTQDPAQTYLGDAEPFVAMIPAS